MDTKITDEEFPLKVAEPTANWHLPSVRERISKKPTDNLWQRILAFVFLLTGFAFFMFVDLNIRSEVAFTVAASQGIFLMFVSQALLVYLYRRQSNDVETGSGLRRLHAHVPEGVDLLVKIEVVRDGSMTGRDRGFIWLDDGTWYFKGLQTAFRFNQQDVVPVEAWPRSIAPDPSQDKPPRVLPMKSRHGQLVLRVDAIDPFEDYAKRKRVKVFYRQMFDWLNERPRGAIESLLPPTTVHPSLIKRGFARVEGLVAAGVMIALDSAVLARLPREGFSTNLGNYGFIAALFVTGLVFLSVRFAWLEMRDVSVRARLGMDPD